MRAPSGPVGDGKRVQKEQCYPGLQLCKAIGKARVLEVFMTSSIPVRNRSRNAPIPNRSRAESAAQRSDQALRKTGIRVISDMPWGAHICMFYETKADLLDAAVSYFESGLDSNEFCLW